MKSLSANVLYSKFNTLLLVLKIKSKKKKMVFICFLQADRLFCMRCIRHVQNVRFCEIMYEYI